MNKYIIDTDNAIDLGKSFMFWANNYNGLFEMEKSSGEVKRVTGLPGYGIYEENMFVALVKARDYIVLGSKTGVLKIAVYNCKTTEWRIFDLKDNPLGNKYTESVFGFIECLYYDKYVYVIGHMVPLIIQLDLDTLNIKYIMEWMQDIDLSSIPEKIESNFWTISGLQKYYIPNIFFTKGGVKSQMAYLPMRCGKYVLELNMATAQSRLINIPTCVEAFNEGCVVGNELWLMGCYQHVIVIYNILDGTVREIKITGEIQPTETKSALYYQPIELDEHVLILPLTAEYAYWVDKKTKKMSICPEWIITKTKNTSHIVSKKRIIFADNKICYIARDDKKWKVFDAFSKTEYDMEYMVTGSLELEIWKNKLGMPIKEHKNYMLTNYINTIKNM